MATYPQEPVPALQELDDRLLESRERFVGSLVELTESPPGNEEVLTAFGYAAIVALADPGLSLPPIQQLVDRFMLNRPEMSPEQQVQLFWRQIQFHRGPLDPEYPYAYTDPRRWYGMMKELADDDAALELIDNQLRYFLVQTNEPKRHVGLLLAMKLYEDQLPAEPSVVDWGSSVGLIMMQMKTNLLPHQPDVAHEDTRGYKLDPAVRRAISGIFASQIALGECWGVDMADHDQATMGWAVPGCQYPSEYGDIENQKRLARLTGLRLQELRKMGLNFFQGDFTNEDDMLHFDEATGYRRFDVSWQSTVLYQYQGQPQALRDALHHERQVLKPGGLEVIQDFAYPWNFGQHLRFTPLYGPQSRYNLMVWNHAADESRLELLGQYPNGRCERFTPSRATVRRVIESGLIDIS